MSTGDVYRSSGRASPLVFPLTVLGIAAGVVLAGMYALLLHRLPYVKVNFVISFLFALGLWALVKAIARAGHVRGRAIAVTVGLVIALAALVASFAAGYVLDVRRYVKGHPELRLSVRQVLRKADPRDWLQGRIEGGWQVGRRTESGNTVLFIWGVEAVFALGGAVIGAWSGSQGPYCEGCKRWTTGRTIALEGLNRESVEGVLARRDLDEILGLVASPGGDPASSISLERSVCPVCGGAPFLTVAQVRRVKTRHGIEERRKVLLRNVALSEDQARRFDQRVAASG